MVAGISDRILSFLLRLPDERIVGVLQQIFKFLQVSEIFQTVSSSFLIHRIFLSNRKR